MPRQPRYPLPGMSQHVVQRGNNRQATFFRRGDFGFYKQCLADAALKYSCAIHAYVLMTNHVHLLVTPMAEKALPKLMQSVGRRYVPYINKSHERTGTLWEGRYKSCLVDSDEYLFACHRYIELNPVRAQIVIDPADYAYSSFRCNALGRADPLITPHGLYCELGSSTKARLAAYQRLFGTELNSEYLTSIRRTTESCLVLGSEVFQDRIAATLSRPVRAGKSGRPRKTSV